MSMIKNSLENKLSIRQPREHHEARGRIKVKPIPASHRVDTPSESCKPEACVFDLSANPTGQGHPRQACRAQVEDYEADRGRARVPSPRETRLPDKRLTILPRF